MNAEAANINAPGARIRQEAGKPRIWVRPGESSRGRDDALAKLASRKLSPCRTKVPLKDPITGSISDTAPAGENGVRGSPGVAQIEARCAWKSALVPAFQFNSSRAD